MTWVLTAVRQEAKSLEISAVVHELELAIIALYMELREPIHRRKFVFVVLNIYRKRKEYWVQWLLTTDFSSAYVSL